MRIAPLAVLTPYVLLLASCGDDELQQTFQPETPEPSSEEVDPSPLQAGDYAWFASASYFPAFGSAAPSLSATGELCVRVDEVIDRASRDEASTLNGSLRLTGASEVALDYRDSGSGEATRAQIDSALAPSWVKRILYPNGDAISPAEARIFELEQGPRPDDEPASLVFLEVRSLTGWSGFGSATGDTFDWFAGPPLSLSNDDFFDSTVFDSRPPPVNDINTFILTWRETGDSSYPDGLREPLVHTLRFDFDEAGILRNARELVVPDLNPERALDAGSAPLTCVDGEACVRAVVQDDAFDQLFCRF